MAITIIVGGQYGSEGKGKVAACLAAGTSGGILVRVGGPNSGHTVIDGKGNKHILRMLPTGLIHPDTKGVLPAGSYLDVDVLLGEIKELGVTKDRLFIDQNAVIIEPIDKHDENQLFRERIGSTASGTGLALMRRVVRPNPGVLRTAKDVEQLYPFVCDTKKLMRSWLDHRREIIIEGTQGYGLSNYHSESYPYVTARDTTAAGFLAETGLSPLDVGTVVMVIRTFPIRVPGNSGPLKNEVSWEDVATMGGFNEPFCEYTSVTKGLRRVATFDHELVRAAIVANDPNVIVLNHVDYVDAAFDKETHRFTDKQISFIKHIESSIGRNINYCGYSPSEMADRTWWRKR